MRKKRTFEDLHERALRYKTRGEFQKNDFNAYQIACKRGKNFFDKVCSHMPDRVDQSGENSPVFKWSIKKIQAEADKHPDRATFKKKGSKAYNAACDRGILETICKNMPDASNKAYTRIELDILAKDYLTISDFREVHPGPYSVAVKRDDWDEISFHMKKPTISIPEKAILEAVQKYFPEAKKFRANKLKIPGKEYIKSLEVDVLVKSLGKGIEYDSERFHSLEGLKRGHPTWPEEHVQRYHEIKDEVFKSLGVDILHITQKEWKRDKQACIDKCLKFLGVLWP